jgi:hypothetical protein
MMTKTVYQTDSLGFLVGTTEAEESPQDQGVFLIPRNCKETPPPEPEHQRWPAWINGSWDTVPDFRGTVAYRIDNGQLEIITELGKTLAELGLQPDPPPAPTVDQLLPAKVAELKQSCQSAIESGFQSSALGAPHTYDSRMPQDQINITGAGLGGVDRMFTCTDAAGIKCQRFHTAAQLFQVFTDGAAYTESQKIRFWELMSRVESAQTTDELNAIHW